MAPEQLYIQFDENTAEASRTISFSGESRPKKENEYNVSIFDSAGESVTGIVAGTISVNVYSPGADRPETTATVLDLSTDCRKFTLFYSSVERAVFSVSGLALGQKVAIQAIKGEG